MSGLEYESPSNMLKESSKTNAAQLTTSATPNKYNLRGSAIHNNENECDNFLKTPKAKVVATDSIFVTPEHRLNMSPFFNKE